MLRRLILVLTVAFAVATASASAAWAESWTARDRHGDGFRGGEITRISGRNAHTEVQAHVDFKNLRRDQVSEAFLVVDTHRLDGTDYMVFTHWTGTRYRNSLVRTVPFSDANAHHVRCPRMTVRWRLRTEVMTFRIPQQCLKRPKDAVRLGFYIDNGNRGSDWAPGRFARPGPWLDRAPR